MEIVLITGNKNKLNIAQKVFEQYGINLIQENIETPEIQSTDTKDIAEYSAEYGANFLKKPVIKTDTGYYFKSMNGFPGPFVKYVCQWFKVEDLLKIAATKKDRNIIVRETIAFCKPGEKPISFTGELKGELAKKAGGEGTIFDQLLILDGFKKPQGLIKREELLDYWDKNHGYFHDLAKYIKDLKY
ncbi:MAG: non-canonical purine NTP pyrophosphatase [Candidatus Shapirobacteria bacterium]|nr:non-canonical purine NTP pyrophosphatase [Candidatus Shapirobacteria bacterium]